LLKPGLKLEENFCIDIRHGNRLDANVSGEMLDGVSKSGSAPSLQRRSGGVNKNSTALFF
jgi:hypothetical protein